jgi:hypothetical protein
MAEDFLALWRHWRVPARSTTRACVLTPSLSHATFWKELLLREKLPIFHVEWLTPARLRRRLLARLHPGAAHLLGREEWRFLLQESLRPFTEKSPLLHSLAGNATPLLRAVDELRLAGHDLSILTETAGSDPAFAAWLKFWIKLEKKIAAHDRAAVERDLASRARQQPPEPAQLLVAGFDLQHLASWRLLETALASFENTAVLTLLPRTEDEALQRLWLAQLESWMPTAKSSLPESTVTPIPPLSEIRTPHSAFHLCPHRQAELTLIFRQIRAWLAKATPWTRIGIVFPARSPLASMLGQTLREAGLPFYSEFERRSPERFDQALLRRWLELQRDGLAAEAFLAFWKSAYTVPWFREYLEVESLTPPGALQEILHDVFARWLVDPADFLHAALPRPKAPADLTAFLHRWKNGGQWPESAPLATYAAAFSSQIDFLAGPNIGAEIRRFLADQLSVLSALWPEAVPRAEAVRLLLDFIMRPTSPAPDSPWNGVNLLTPATARGQEWDFLLLAQVNQGDWPSETSPLTLLDDDTRLRLNRQAQEPSPHGGEETRYRPGLYPLLTAADRYRLAKAHFAYLCESARTEVALTASAWDEIETGRALYPSEFFTQAWEEKYGRKWTAPIQDSLLAATAPLSETPPEDPFPSSEPFLQAYHHRRDFDQPFGPFQFVIEPVPHARPLRARDAEAILRDPAAAWFKLWMQVETERPSWKSEDLVALFQGNHIHRLLSESLRLPEQETGWQPVPEIAAWKQALRDVARRRHHAAHRLFADNKKNAPAWLDSELHRLAALAERLIDQLSVSVSDGWTHVRSEYAFPKDMPHSLPEFPEYFPWRGVADLLFLDGPDWQTATRALVVDFKTGRGSKAFDPKKAGEEGAYFQLIVYAALVQSMRTEPLPVSVLVVPPHAPAGAPIFMDPSDSSWQPQWQILRQAWLEGRWGQVAEIWDRFRGGSRLPFATLDIAAEDLAAKWALTPGLNLWSRDHDAS